MEPDVSTMWWDETNVTNVRTCTDYCANHCGACLVDSICHDEELHTVSTPPAGVCNRFSVSDVLYWILPILTCLRVLTWKKKINYAELEHFFPRGEFRLCCHKLHQLSAVRGSKGAGVERLGDGLRDPLRERR